MHGGRRTAGRGRARSRADEPIPRRGAAKRRKRAEADRRRPFRRRGERLRRLRQEPSTEQRFAAARAGCARRSARSRGGSGRVGSGRVGHHAEPLHACDGPVGWAVRERRLHDGAATRQRRAREAELAAGERRPAAPRLVYAAAAARRRAVPRRTIDRTRGRRGAAHALVRCDARAGRARERQPPTERAAPRRRRKRTRAARQRRSLTRFASSVSYSATSVGFFDV
ncbi:Uncharacterised protein [Burkholderia pseudomallei]|nr:Uncharacterised protein [Burkholderia pseudomallei]VCS32002.1 Uncharacterised protein [Burkholderia pseudomallei]VCS51797.1 Uncharacterised protein [Burkholderia pseudomallei]VCS53844.1 Uncharacterised protein [Burkholderia pseudomallei]